MYEVIQSIIDHEWVSNYGGDQQYIYYIMCALIPTLSVVIIDIIRDIFSSFTRG